MNNVARNSGAGQRDMLLECLLIEYTSRNNVILRKSLKSDGPLGF